MLPVLEVSRLSAASSFYSAISQPLSIRYLASLPAHSQSAQTASASSLFTTILEPAPSTALSIAQPALTFGSIDSKKACFQIRQVAPTHDRPLRRSHLVLAADSPDTVTGFHDAALKAHPRSSAVIGTRASLESDSATTIGAATASSPFDHSDICARVTDFDGNTMEVAYHPAQYSYSSHYGGSSHSRHRSARDLDYDHGHGHDYDYDSNRVLYYSYDAPQTEVFSPRSGSGSRYHEMPSSYEYRYHDSVVPSSSSRYHGGSARTPTLRRSATSTSAASYEVPSSSRYAPRESYKGMGSAGMFGMAAVGAFAGAAITYSVMRSSSRSRSRSSRDREYEDVRAVPSFQRRSTFPESYQDYASSRYGGGDDMRGRSQKGAREVVEEVYEYDNRGRLTSSHHRSSGSVGGSGSRARSEAAYDREPMMIAEGSYHSSRRGSSGLPPPAISSSRRGSSFEYHAEPTERADRDSYVSGARSHRTARGSGAGSRLPSTPPNASRSATVRQSMSRSGSYMSARNVPLPASGVGSSYAQWEEDDRFADDNRFLYDDNDNDSVAPSDSISCVGSRSHSSRHHR
ncbi:hypothetical protein SCUCBS95973_000297 [Sporothrix curviconia]|uniref:Uncharacterized protein n=1 Tax=Sporothrix curviconia TaxID=1260050 RepID=A0ABP0AP32_9PEZI